MKAEFDKVMTACFFPKAWMLALCAGVLAAGPFNANAGADAPLAGYDWEYSASIYLWGAGINGTTAGGADVTVGFDTLIENLNMAFMGSFEARRAGWSLLADLVYLNVGANDSGKVPVPIALGSTVDVGVSAGVKTKGWLLNLIGGYSLWRTPQAELDVLAGARYLDLKLDFGLGLGVGPFAASREFSASDDVWDAVIGIKGHADLNPRWYFPYHIDVGTGESDLTWQVSAGLAYRFNWGDVVLVYRHIEWDFGSDSQVDDISFSGPLLAAKLRF